MNNSSPRFKVIDSNVRKDNSEDTSLHLGLISNPAKVKNNLLDMKIKETSETSTESSDSSSTSDETSRKSTTTKTSDKPKQFQMPNFGPSNNFKVPNVNQNQFNKPTIPQNNFIKHILC